MSSHTDKDKKKLRKLRLDLLKAKGKLFCVVYAPIILALLEIIVEEYQSYASKTKGGGV